MFRPNVFMTFPHFTVEKVYIFGSITQVVNMFRISMSTISPVISVKIIGIFKHFIQGLIPMIRLDPAYIQCFHPSQLGWSLVQAQHVCVAY